MQGDCRWRQCRRGAWGVNFDEGARRIPPRAIESPTEQSRLGTCRDIVGLKITAPSAKSSSRIADGAHARGSLTCALGCDAPAVAHEVSRMHDDQSTRLQARCHFCLDASLMAELDESTSRSAIARDVHSP